MGSKIIRGHVEYKVVCTLELCQVVHMHITIMLGNVNLGKGYTNCFALPEYQHSSQIHDLHTRCAEKFTSHGCKEYEVIGKRSTCYMLST